MRRSLWLALLLLPLGFPALCLAQVPAMVPLGVPGPLGGSPLIQHEPGFRLLLTRSVQQELRLDRDQLARIDKIPAAVLAQYKEERARLEAQAATINQGLERLTETIDQGVFQAAGTILKPEQSARLRQLKYHLMGINAFQLGAVQKELNLSDKQREALKKLAEKMLDEQLVLVQKITAESKGNVEEFNKRFGPAESALMRKTFEQALGLLSMAQRQKWQQLTGAPWTAPRGAAPFQPDDPPLGPLADLSSPTAQLLGLHGAAVSEELKVTGEQLSQLRKALMEAYRNNAKTQEQLALQQVDQARKEIELWSRMGLAARAQVEKEVLKPEQRERYNQLLKQMVGVDGLMTVLLQLPQYKWTAEQKKQLLAIQADHAQAGRAFLRTLPSPGASPTEEMVRTITTKVMELDRKAIEKLGALLDAEQKKLWQSEYGTPFDFSSITEYPALAPPASWTISPASQAIQRAVTHFSRKEYAQASAAFQEAEKLDGENPYLRNNYAFFLATCPEDKYRDGKKALSMAKELVAREPRNGEFLDTLAAAHAEVGEFDEAVQCASRAIEVAAPFRKTEYQQRLQRYKEKKPARD